MKKSIVFLSLLFSFQVFGSSWFSWLSSKREKAKSSEPMMIIQDIQPIQPISLDKAIKFKSMKELSNAYGKDQYIVVDNEDDLFARNTSLEGKAQEYLTTAGLTVAGALAGNNLGEKGGVVSMAGTAAGLYGGYKLADYVNNSVSKEQARKILADYKKKMKELTLDLVRCKNESSRLINSVNALTQSVSTLTAANMQSQSNLELSEKNLELAQKNLEKLTKEYNNLNTTYGKLKVYYEKLQNSVNDVSDKVSDSMKLQLKTTILSIQTTLDNAYSAIGQLNGQIEMAVALKTDTSGLKTSLKIQKKIITNNSFALDMINKHKNERFLFPTFKRASQIMALENGDAGNIRDVSDSESDLGSEPDTDRYQNID